MNEKDGVLLALLDALGWRKTLEAIVQFINSKLNKE